ncbi:hypothetical protein INT48_000281 [Thamnidium elegans]|uniref:STB6-like N-terminal domain-containing protein n=1 Tax=Thamnidium elegans TaxID=101142 RepID=A0A8H7SNY9_9FUNG|nr:hypothetical protein INT48_000281 [Thamnidium elegans]
MSDKKRFVFAERAKALQMASTCGLSVISELQVLTGYQIYIVEQWICDRKIASNVVNVFTGDDSHIILVAVIAISTAELQHPRPQIQSFLNLGSNLKLKPTPLGDIQLTNPSELPFDMDMVLIPDGDYDSWIHQAYVNINLRRTNCTGRSSLNLRPPNPASEEKFRSLYKIADSVNFQDAVILLVSLVQIALYLFKLLDKDYIDGLICNETNNALWIFYTKYNPIKTTEFSLKEPWMEPHLLAAIISKLLMCRNKLQDNSFTTLKDPFTDYDNFRIDIGDYQRYKNIRATKFIDLETLAKLNEHSYSQLKVKKVIKSKLDDISGITNSPLFNETSDPEVFRHHATIDSLRAIWRPRLRGAGVSSPSSSSNHSNDPLQPQSELIHMIKGVSRSSGAALSRVAGSIPWITTDNKKHQLSPSSTDTEYTSALDDTSRISSAIPSRKPSPLSIQTNLSVIDNNDPQSSVAQGISPGHLDQDIPSYVQTAPNTSPLPKLRLSRSSNTNHQQFIYSKDQGDFIPLLNQKRKSKHKRTVSDGILLDPKYMNTLLGETDTLRIALKNKQPLVHKRSLTTSSLMESTNQRPMAAMNIQTYMIYEKLVQQQRCLQQKYEEMKHIADVYEKTATDLKETHESRLKIFESIQKESRGVMDEQNLTERRLKNVEDNSAKLYYELRVLNDKLKDIEDNVGTFYGKVGLLERRMDDSQQSITTMLIIGNYLNHYWIKVREWIQWLNKDDTAT